LAAEQLRAISFVDMIGVDGGAPPGSTSIVSDVVKPKQPGLSGPASQAMSPASRDLRLDGIRRLLGRVLGVDRSRPVVGGGLSLGDRDAAPPSGNSRQPSLDCLDGQKNGYNTNLDRSIEMKPKNDLMDGGMWKLPSPGGGSLGGGSGAWAG